MQNENVKVTKDKFYLSPVDVKEHEKINRPSLTFWQDARRRLLSNRGARIAMVLLGILVIMAIVGPMLNSYTYKEQIAPIGQHAKLPPRIPGLEKLGIMDGTRTITVGPKGLERYKEGTYEILDEYMGEDSYGNEQMQYKIKEYTYKVNNVDDKYFWFGTDELGRDQWTRVWKGTQISLLIGLIAAAIDVLIGVTYGSIAGYFGGKTDMVMMRIIEIISGIPGIVIIILFILVFEKGILPITLAIALTNWISMARVVRSQFMKLKNQEFVLASKTIGASNIRMIMKHFIPNILGQIIIMITFSIPSAIFYEAFLAFIGLGIPAPRASLGVLINDGYKLMKTATYTMVIPSIVISVLMLSLNIFANGLRDALDPKMRNM